jgi:FlaA1/EpsC-like NDP-sugar epimerase/EAL domain-containing protein (putative c-di-GMP-specific phosphodiesterase class I)
MIYKLDKKLLKLRNRHFFLIDTLIFLITPLLALIVRLDVSFQFQPYIDSLVIFTLFSLGIKQSIFYFCGIYRRYWRYASIDELAQIAIANAIAAMLTTISFLVLEKFVSINNLPQSLPFLDGILSFIAIGAIRFSIRAVERVNQRRKRFYRRDRVLIIGAGSAGVSLAQELQKNPQLGLLPVAFIDDDPEKLNLRIRSLSVVGNRHQIPKIAEALHARRAIIAMPTAPGAAIREIVDICRSKGVKTSTVPAIDEIINGRSLVKNIRDIKIEDLLRREPIQTNIASVRQFIKGKKVLITGAGGSIGSELCRQIFRCNPSEILLLGHGENSVFNIQQELEQYRQILKQEGRPLSSIPNLEVFVADLRARSRLEYGFERFKPEIVFHAAAHKHVPLMELNPPEAITNNVMGTKNLIDLALKYNVENFVMISTDKAINPTNVMGASKRVAEMLVMQAAKTSGKPFVVVRFGNVLGSRGSVVPTFQKQIETGGPVTITHPDICRYFMTIPEAVQLVLQAAVLSRGGEVFMLNMGEPVKIVDLARDLIELSGYEVGKDIEIVFTGLRPGEKLYEELLNAGEEYQTTKHPKLLVVKNASATIPDNLNLTFTSLCQAAMENNSNLILFLLEQVVSGYKPSYKKNDSQVTITANALKNKQQDLLVPSSSLGKLNVFSGLKNLELEKALEEALVRQEFKLFYQPIVELETGKLIGFEALLRWQHPEWGLVSPINFISIAEETGLIVAIGCWVFREVCHQLKTWQDRFATQLTIGVNISSKQFLNPDLIEEIAKNLQEYQLEPKNLRLEIAENIIQENPNYLVTILPQLQNLGIQLQIDNFGTNYGFYSSCPSFLSSLYEQFDRVKIDRGLIGRIDNDLESLEIVRTIANSARHSGIDTIAAGVENTKQIAQLKAIQCEYVQGYFFSKPLESDEVKKLIGSHL